MDVVSAGSSVIGGRSENQDSYRMVPSLGLYCVADGVGGGLDGGVASQMAVTGIEKALSEGMPASAIFPHLQGEIYRYALAKYGQPAMGTTLTAALHKGGRRFHIIHVGDSRCYRMSPTQLIPVTEDHEFFDSGLGAMVLGSYLGMPTDTHPFLVFNEEISLASGEALLLCSDGLYKQMEPEDIRLRFEQEHNLETFVQSLCATAAQIPQSDNVTVVCVSVHD